MPKNVLLVHGYSVRSLDTYGLLPQMLVGDGYNAQDVLLSAFDSLNDDVTCDDLARALEVRVSKLEQSIDITDTAIIVHSTGAIITRRWLLNRFMAGNNKLPSHFISLAGANHGSSLAQLGGMQIVYLYRWLTGGTAVGAEVLQDLDYGSEFLLRLNNEWLDAYCSSNPPKTRPFSLIGDDHSAADHQLFWQTHEDGSDGTVRVSGGNLNYRMLTINQNDPKPAISVKKMPYAVPHLVLHGLTHTGNNGIMGGNADAMKIIYPEIQSALKTSDQAAYNTLAAKWAQRTAAWTASTPNDCGSTIVFSLHHPGGRKVQDSLILIGDKDNPDDNQTLLQVGKTFKDRQPIQNNVVPSSVSFYIDYNAFLATYPHAVQIQINSGCAEIVYPPAKYTVNQGDPAAIQPNEFSYVTVFLQREPQNTFEIIPWSDKPDLKRAYPPLPMPKAGKP